MASKKGFPVTESLVLPEGRLSFPAMITPENKKKQEGDETYDQYGGTMLYPYGTDLSALKALITKAVEMAWPDPKDRPRKFNPTIKDGNNGDHTRNGIPAGEKWDGYKDHYYITLVSYRPFGIIDSKGTPIRDEKEVYGGSYGRAQVAAQAYNTSGGIGVRLYMQNYMKTRDGEPFGGCGEKPETAFASFIGEGEATDFGDTSGGLF